MLFFKVGPALAIYFEFIFFVVLFVGRVVHFGFLAAFPPAGGGFRILPPVLFLAEEVFGGEFSLNLNSVAVFGKRGLFIDAFFGSRLYAELLFGE